MQSQTVLVHGELIAGYGFGEGHPFGQDRHGVFMQAMEREGLRQAVQSMAPQPATREELEWFHVPAYVDLVEARHLVVVGGTHLLEGSVEIDRLVRDNWALAAFVFFVIVLVVEKILRWRNW